MTADYSEVLAEIAEVETKGLIKKRKYKNDELFLINAIIEKGNKSVHKAVKILDDGAYEFYEGITQMADVAYQDYKIQKSVADMHRFALELVFDLEQYTDWHKWGEDLLKEFTYIFSHRGIIMLWD